jgi:hypothetical protein
MKFLVSLADTERQIPDRTGVEWRLELSREPTLRSGTLSGQRRGLQLSGSSESVVDAKNKRVRVKFGKKLTLEDIKSTRPGCS